MPARLLVWILLVLLALAALAWWRPAWVPAPLRAWLPADLVPPARPVPAAPAGVRKCRGPGGVVYTQDACPAGTREESLTGGTVTVLPAAPRSAGPAAAGSAASSPLRRLAGEADTRELQERRIERAVQGTP